MYKGKKFLSIIPARSGSKGLINKNIKMLNEKPLMAHTIDSSKKSEIFDDIVVSTDSIVYAATAKKYGAYVPNLRPEELSQDTSSVHDVILYTLDLLKKENKEYDYLVLLQPTSPLRNENDIKRSVDLLFEKNANAVVSVCEVDHPSFLNMKLNESCKLDGFSNNLRRQDFHKEYRLNGAIYICNIKYYLKYKDFYKENCFAYVMNKFNSIDIDDIYDFKLAEVILKNAL